MTAPLYVCTGQAPNKKCKATQIDATNRPRNAWPAVHAWLATHGTGVNELESGNMTTNKEVNGQLASQLALKIVEIKAIMTTMI